MNYLVIGLGSAGQRHLRVLRTFFNKNAKLFVYRGGHIRGNISIDLKKEDFTQDPVKIYNATEIHNLNDIKLKHWDLVIIATPPKSHLEYFNLVFKTSKRVIIEKPISTSALEAEAIYKNAELNNKPVIIGYQMSFHPLKEFIDNNIQLVGKIESCDTKFKEDISSMNPFRNMEQHHLSRKEGGGVFLALSHDIDFMINILSEFDLIDMHFENIHRNPNQILVECTFKSTLKSNNEVVSMSNEFSMLPGNTVRLGQINGSKASIVWNLIEGTVKLIGQNGELLAHQDCTIDRDELIRRQTDYILSTKIYTQYCQKNLYRSKLISEIASFV